MNAKELREAAEKEVVDTRLVLSHLAEGFIARQKRLEDRLAIAEHILETVRDDDDEPADASWQMDIAVANDFLPYTETFLYDVWTGGHGKTRGQFRKLCEGLGIQLKETT